MVLIVRTVSPTRTLSETTSFLIPFSQNQTRKPRTNPQLKTEKKTDGTHTYARDYVFFVNMLYIFRCQAIFEATHTYTTGLEQDHENMTSVYVYRRYSCSRGG